MIFSGRVIALFLSISIAAITVGGLYLLELISFINLIWAYLISFASGYLLINITLEFLIFREVKKFYLILNKLKNDEFFPDKNEKIKGSHPFKRINREIFNYAFDKQREINDLKKLENFRREFLADVAHELKTPIFTAQGFVHTLLDGAADDKKNAQKFLKKAAKSLDGLDMLVQDLLTISKMETGEIKMNFEHFDISETICDVFDQFESQAEKKEITLKRSEGKSAPMYVYADEQRIYQVMVNLISNSIKYTRRGGTVNVSLRDELDWVKVFVNDNGKGIPQANLKRIFERFYRIEKSRSKDKGGTGLGLAIVKHIVEAHQSKINVTSTVGKGSTFSFELEKGNAEMLNDFKTTGEDY